MRDEEFMVEEFWNMKMLVVRGMDDGVLGFFIGLYYVLVSFVSIEEVIELVKVVVEKGGMYDVYIWDESSYNIGLLVVIEEMLEIGR